MPLTQIEGVEKVSLSGTTPYEWVIRFDPYALQHAGLAADDLATAFNDYFRNDIVGLTLQPDETGTPQSIVLRLRNRATLDFDRIPVATRHGHIYRLGDFRLRTLAGAAADLLFPHQRTQHGEPRRLGRNPHQHARGRPPRQGRDDTPRQAVPRGNLRDAHPTTPRSTSPPSCARSTSARCSASRSSSCSSTP